MKFLEARNQHRDTGIPLRMYRRAAVSHHRAFIIYGVNKLHGLAMEDEIEGYRERLNSSSITRYGSYQ